MQLNIDLGRPFDRIAFVGERDEAERMIHEGWTPVWEPKLKSKKVKFPNYSSYFILVCDSQQDK